MVASSVTTMNNSSAQELNPLWRGTRDTTPVAPFYVPLEQGVKVKTVIRDGVGFVWIAVAHIQKQDMNSLGKTFSVDPIISCKN